MVKQFRCHGNLNKIKWIIKTTTKGTSPKVKDMTLKNHNEKDDTVAGQNIPLFYHKY